jgi:5-methylcytosine-specific restriction protein A
VGSDCPTRASSLLTVSMLADRPGVFVRTQCLDCGEHATHAGRCESHHAAYRGRRSVRSHAVRRAAIACGNNAAATLRRAVRRAGGAECGWCRGFYRPSLVDIDHVLPLSLGGEDVDSNVQPLCKTCHKAKTAVDFGKRPF